MWEDVFHGQDIGSALAAPTFVVATNTPRGVRTEFCIMDGKRVQFHFWPAPAFPQDFGRKLADTYGMATGSFSARYDFVPEVNSWFLELAGFPMMPNGNLVESLLGRLRDAVG